MRKYFYILITLLAVLSIGFIGCKNKPTTVADFIDEAGEKTPGETLIPSSTIDINVNQGAVQYDKKTFESTTRKKPDGTEFKYTITFEKQNDEYKTVLLKFTGYDQNGNDISKNYSLGGARSSSKEQQVFIPYQFGGNESSDLIIKKTGFAYFKPKNFKTYIELALK